MGLTAVWITRFESGVSQTVILYGAILVTANLVRSRERLVRQQAEAARLNEQLSHARLAALAQQIQPHFLFNALNAIAGLMREGRPDDAVEAIATVSDCLRATLRESRGQIGELGDELDLVARYLDVQKLRFGDRMRVSIDVPQTLLGCRVPEFILQPLVDNAIKHGISRSARAGYARRGRMAPSRSTSTTAVHRSRPFHRPATAASA